MNILQTIGAGIASLGIFIGGLFGFTPESEPIAYAPEEEALGADTVLPTGIQTYTLAGTGISSTASSFTLTSLTLPQNGYAIQDSDMSDTFYITFEPGSRSRQEFVSCTTIGANTGGNVTISGCTRGLSPLTPYTASTSLRFAHSGGTSVIFSNAPQFYNQYPAKANNETITGQWTFSNFPITASSSAGTATTSGTVELATGDEAASSTLSGNVATSKLALHTGISTSSAPASGNVVVVTGDDGNIDTGFIPYGAGASTTIRTYTSTTTAHTWVKPSNVSYIRVRLWGAGGSGGQNGSASNSACGGGGGGYFDRWFVASELVSSTYEVVVGTGGSSVPSGSNNGNQGTASTFGSTLAVAYGGGGGGQGASSCSGGAGGGAYATGTTNSTSQSDVLATGGGTGAGGTPSTVAYYGAGGGGSDTNETDPGVGGNSIMGGAGGGAASANNLEDIGGTSKYGGNGGNGDYNSGGAGAGSQPGGGGGGGFGVASGAGGAGQVIITEYF